ncbi:MAG: cold shock domain-containing protein [Rhodospirillaceae bacterium]|nr:cold shock domain-containing protein [Rhodospirillaceae bacterium]
MLQTSSQAEPAKSGITAKVKWFNPAKGFGFVAPNDGTSDAFLHVSVVQRAGLRTLRQGATIICDLTHGPRGPQVSIIDRVDDSTVADDMPPADGDETVLEGEIKFFAVDKGYGFGMPVNGGADVFIGIGALQRSNLDRLESGQQVRMYVRPGKKGPMAVRIEVLSQPSYNGHI